MEQSANQEKKVKVVKPEESNQIEPIQKVEFQRFTHKGWEFYHSTTGMSSEKEMDQVSDKVGIMGLPEVFYGSNHLLIANKEHNILLDFNAADSLSYSGFEKRSQFLNPKSGKNLTEEEEKKSEDVNDLAANLEKLVLENSGLSSDEKDFNLIDVIPKIVQVQQAGFWKKKDTSKIKDYKEVTSTSDWTYSTPYKGTVRYLNKAAKKVRDETSLEIENSPEGQTDHMSVVQMPEAAIPFDMLGPENPIIHFGEVYQFESDLEDCGYTMSKIRFRVMDDCFYILLRYYLRVDGVRVRVFDTRIFHEFGQDFVHREFQYRESNYDELRQAGFEFEPDWMLSPNQSDMVFPKLKQQLLVQEQILF